MGNTAKLVTVIVIAAVVLAVIVIGIPYMLVQSVQRNTNQALKPVEQANEQLKTQVSRLLNPTPTIIPDPETIIHDVRSLARLETIQYTIEKVITAETGQGQFALLFGDKLLFVAHGTVIAGVDLSQMNAQDLKLENGVLTVRLPEAEVFVATLNNDRSYVYDRQTGILTHGDANLETSARKAAENEILKAALEDGILKTAQTNAESYLIRLFNSLGYKDVVFLRSTPAP